MRGRRRVGYDLAVSHITKRTSGNKSPRRFTMSIDQDRIKSLERTVGRLQGVLGAGAVVVVGVMMGQAQPQQQPPTQQVPQFAAAAVPPTPDGKTPGFAVLYGGSKERVILVRDDARPAMVMELRYQLNGK
jgi:hypothetical protein